MIDDVRLAIKRLRSSPGYTAAAVATLALAIGANTAILTIADAALFRPLPYTDPDRVYVIRTVDSATGERWAAPAPGELLKAIDDFSRTMGKVGRRGPTMKMTHVDATGAEWIETFAVDGTYFQVLGVSARLGRLLEDNDADSAGTVAVLSHSTWQQRFGGDLSIVGRVVRLGDRDRRVVGVLPPAFLFPSQQTRFMYGLTGHVDFVTATAAAWSSIPWCDCGPARRCRRGRRSWMHS